MQEGEKLWLLPRGLRGILHYIVKVAILWLLLLFMVGGRSGAALPPKIFNVYGSNNINNDSIITLNEIEIHK